MSVYRWEHNKVALGGDRWNLVNDFGGVCTLVRYGRLPVTRVYWPMERTDAYPTPAAAAAAVRAEVGVGVPSLPLAH